MKTILLSIQPKWCEKIFNGEKTIEVRKTAPKEAPFRAFIYQTKKKWIYRLLEWLGLYQQKIIGEFVCDYVEKEAVAFTEMGNLGRLYHCRLSLAELKKYAGKRTSLYYWHITDLKVYDKPRELGEFRATDIEAVKRCELRERIYTNPVYTNGALLKGSYLCRDKNNWCEKCHTKPVTRAPQSFCYIQDPEV